MHAKGGGHLLKNVAGQFHVISEDAHRASLLRRHLDAQRAAISERDERPGEHVVGSLLWLHGECLL